MIDLDRENIARLPVFFARIQRAPQDFQIPSFRNFDDFQDAWIPDWEVRKLLVRFTPSWLE